MKRSSSFRSEFLKVRKTKPFKICLLLQLGSLIANLVSFIVNSILYQNEEYLNAAVQQYRAVGRSDEAIEFFIESSLHPKAFDYLSMCCAGVIICGIFAVLFFTRDQHFGIFQQLIARGVSRKELYFVKLKTSFLTALSFTAVGILVLFVGMGLIFSFGIPSDIDIPLYVLKYVGAVLLSAWLFVAFAQMVSTFAKSSTVAVVIVFLTDVVGMFIKGLLNAVFAYGTGGDIGRFWFASTPYKMFDSSLPLKSYLTYGALVVVYALFFTIVGYARFSKISLAPETTA